MFTPWVRDQCDYIHSYSILPCQVPLWNMCFEASTKQWAAPELTNMLCTQGPCAHNFFFLALYSNSSVGTWKKALQGSKFKSEFGSTCATRCKFLGALLKCQWCCAHSWNIFQHSKRNFVSPRSHAISSMNAGMFLPMHRDLWQLTVALGNMDVVFEKNWNAGFF